MDYRNIVNTVEALPVPAQSATIQGAGQPVPLGMAPAA